MKYFFTSIGIVFFASFFFFFRNNEVNFSSLLNPNSINALIAISIVSLLPNLLLFFLPFIINKLEKKIVGIKIKNLMLCFAIGGLLGDVFLHILPHLLGAHNHHDSGISLQFNSIFSFFSSNKEFIEHHQDDHHDHEHHDHEHHDHHNDIQVDDHHHLEDHHDHNQHDHHGHHEHILSTFTFLGLDRNLWIQVTILFGFFFFFVVERLTSIFLSHSHSHSHSCKKNEDIKDDKANGSVFSKISPSGWLNLLADSMHNFTDGIAIGASFASGRGLAASTFLSVICHEIPHEVGDFTLLIESGLSTTEAIKAQFVTAIAAFLGTVVGLIASRSQIFEDILLSFTSGGFLYIASVSVVPKLFEEDENTSKISRTNKVFQLFLEFISFSLGVLMMIFVSFLE